jgi:peptidyl-prolyl cis-trans isomerase D
MLRTMHRYQKQVGGLVIVCAIVLAMSGFGLNMLTPRREVHAIKVNERSVTYPEFYRERRRLEGQYRQMFGDNYARVAEMVNRGLDEQVKDRLIHNLLLDQFSEQLGLAAGKAELQKIQGQIIPAGTPEDLVRAMLREQNLSFAEFELELKRELVRQGLATMLEQAALPSELEIQRKTTQSETKIDVRYVEITAQRFADSLKEPDDQALTEYYQTRKEDFRLPVRVRYSYVLKTPSDFVESVQVSEDEIELFYTDNSTQFLRPEELRLRHIQLSFPEKAGAEQIEATKRRAEELLAKVKAGENFESLALEASDDIATKTLGGELGWLTKASSALPKEVLVKAFENKEGDALQLLEAPSGYHIVRRDEYRAAATKPLAEVREQVLARIRERELPAYAHEAMLLMQEQWINSGKNLSEFAKEKNLPISQTETALAAGKDPSAAPAGLTAKVLALPEDSQKEMLTLDDKLLLVQVEQRLESEIPALEAVRAEVLAAWKKNQSATLAREHAAKIAEQAKGSSLKAALEGSPEGLLEAKDLSLAQNREPPFSAPEVERVLFSEPRVDLRSAAPIEVNSKWYVFEIGRVQQAQYSELSAEVKARYRESVANEVEQNALRALVNQLEAQAAASGGIDYDPNLIRENA